MNVNEVIDTPVMNLNSQIEDPQKEIPPEDRNIYTGLRIFGKWFYFERRFLWKNQISMMVPKEFIPMNEDIAKAKYPSNQRPEFILTDDSGSVNILFQEMDEEVEEEELVDLEHRIFTMMKRMNRNLKLLSEGVAKRKEGNIAFVEFSNPVMDGKLYNLMFFLESNGKSYMGNINCRTKEMKYWRPAALDMMKSIQVDKHAD